MIESATSTQPTPTETDPVPSDVPAELRPYYRRGALSEDEAAAAYGDEGRDWLYRRIRDPLVAEQEAWRELEAGKLLHHREERQRQVMPTVLATVRERETIGDAAARLAARPLTPDELREFVHLRRLAQARRQAEQVAAAERDRAYTERLTTCETCGTVQPASPISGSTLTTIEVAGRTARVCAPCAAVIPVLVAERGAAELVDGATRRQHVERWLDGR